jgi:hypothetical protein
MARYLAIWEADDSTRAADTTQRASGWGSLMDSMEQDMKQGAVKDFGFFAGAPNGFAIFEGTEAEVEQVIQRYGPLLSCTVYPLSSSKHTEPSTEDEAEIDFPLIRSRLKGRSLRCYGGFLKLQ